MLQSLAKRYVSRKLDEQTKLLNIMAETPKNTLRHAYADLGYAVTGLKIALIKAMFCPDK